MSMMESTFYGRNSNISKWVSLGMIQRAEQVRDIAEVLDATMQDLADQMASLDEKMDLLTEASEAIQEQLDEIVDIMNGETNPDTLLSLETSEINPVPF